MCLVLGHSSVTLSLRVYIMCPYACFVDLVQATKPLPMRKIVFADEAGKKLCHVKTFQSRSLPKSILDLL